jgi:hypothetical protein
MHQMPLVPDQGAVEQFAAAGSDPPFHDRVTPHRQLRPIVTVWGESFV